jgi:hypothetical protein
VAKLCSESGIVGKMRTRAQTTPSMLRIKTTKGSPEETERRFAMLRSIRQ